MILKGDGENLVINSIDDDEGKMGRLRNFKVGCDFVEELAMPMVCSGGAGKLVILKTPNKRWLHWGSNG
jgi:imidazole glycerol phosphate synthase subunit HisF